MVCIKKNSKQTTKAVSKDENEGMGKSMLAKDFKDLELGRQEDKKSENAKQKKACIPLFAGALCVAIFVVIILVCCAGEREVGVKVFWSGKAESQAGTQPFWRSLPTLFEGQGQPEDHDAPDAGSSTSSVTPPTNGGNAMDHHDDRSQHKSTGQKVCTTGVQHKTETPINLESNSQTTRDRSHNVSHFNLRLFNCGPDEQGRGNVTVVDCSNTQIHCCDNCGSDENEESDDDNDRYQVYGHTHPNQFMIPAYDPSARTTIYQDNSVTTTNNHLLSTTIAQQQACFR